MKERERVTGGGPFKTGITALKSIQWSSEAKNKGKINKEPTLKEPSTTISSSRRTVNTES